MIEAVVATIDSQQPAIPFYIHRGHHVLSKLDESPEEQRVSFDKVELPSKRLSDIIGRHGEPFYVKIDVEGYDQHLLNALFDAGIFPPYFSTESHAIEVFATLVANGRYPCFKIVDGPSIPHLCADHPIETKTGSMRYFYPAHSAGPFGNDIIGSWQTPAGFLHTLAHHNLGWKDIHVSRVDAPDA